MASSPSSIARPRRLALLAVAGASTIVLTVAVAVASSATASRFAADVVAGVPFSPTEADGLIPADAPLTVENDEHPAMTGLDPTLRDALRAAQQAATADGIVLDVTSGWRSDPYQRWLLEDAIRVYGSEDVAREYVAAPEDSSHVVGEAVDIGSLDAQLWLIDHGRAWGLCQTYANERWHLERATSPGGDCPAPHPDARG